MAELTHGHVVPSSTVQDEAEGDGSSTVTTVLVTGFGPFLDKYPINSSWSIASTLPALLPASKAHPDPIRILVHPWPVKVAYHSVLDLVPGLVDGSSPTSLRPKPDMILHIGLAAGRTFYTAERGSHRSVYFKNEDVDGNVFPAAESDRLWGHLPDVLTTGFDLDDLYARWRRELPDRTVDIRPSDDAGNYLCGFIYYTSMSTFANAALSSSSSSSSSPVEEERPVMFLHVPNLPLPEDVAQGREVVKALIRAMADSRKERGTNHGNKT